ncbi:MAG: T9SS type A sorting domain-containing protein [Bacteroidota bacterium]|nr:T9SS type A sorting domain-containing protein [Bacteroidota bacterium]
MKTSIPSFKKVLCLNVLFILTNTSLYAQHWTQIPLPRTYKQITPYFLNQRVGFIFDYSTSRIRSNLCRTTDGGTNWTVLPFFDDRNIFIQQLYFAGPNRGYAASSDGVYETEDTGSSWRKIYNDGPLRFSSVYAFGNKVFGFASSFSLSKGALNWGPLVMTSDRGNIWDTIIPMTTYFNDNTQVPSLMSPLVFGNKDSVVFAENIDSSNTMLLVYSTNNGKEWSSHKMDMPNQATVTQGLFSFPHCRDILRTFITPNDLSNDDVSFIVHSSDFGAHWDTLSQPPLEIGDWIAGNNCVQYVSDAQDLQQGASRNGLWRSQDRGKSWAYVNGPSFDEIDDQDFHNMFVTGGGSTIYACDFDFFATHNNLWKTTDGGDGTISASGLASRISIDHDFTQGATACDTSSLNIIYQNLSCNYSLLEYFTIDGLDTSQYSAEWKHHLACDGEPDSILVKIFSFNSIGGTFTLRAHFVNDEYEAIDTGIVFTMLPSSGPVESVYLKPFPLSTRAGDTLEIPIFINSWLTPAQPGLATVTLTYVLNTRLLTPFAFNPIHGIIADPIRIDKTSAIVTLHFDPSFSFSGETEIGKLRCVAYVTDTLETDIILTGAAHSSGCLLTLADSNNIHFTLTGCGATTLAKFVRLGTAYEITSIIPNPAGNSVQVRLRNSGSLVHYELLDGLGTSQKSGTTVENSLHINLGGLSSGNYYLRLIGEGGTPVIRTLVVRK